MTADDAPTLRQEASNTPPPGGSPVRLDATTLDDAGHATRYHVGDTLGVGGMGEVRRCRDRRIGRDVAMKVVRVEHTGDEAVRARFLREARIQGQLEHPCIVPVYDVGLGPDGATYFTMKRVRGHTLESILEALARGDEDARRQWSRRRLLTAFSTACGAVEYAHARGVVHRDLKPGNVMLGDFGEVYVLDWGVARLVDDAAAAPDERVHAPVPEHRRTAQGAVIGTPGYMAPEQLTAAPDIDARADVYALGAILFELLALRPAHESSTVEGLMTSTLAGVDGRPSARAPGADVPPELDALTARCLTRDRDARLASVRELRDALERYLDGDRDTERRRAQAAEHATAAALAAQRALGGDDGARSEALREAGRALALDAANHDALRTFVGLMVEAPRELPEAVRRRLAEDEEAQVRAGARGGVRAYLAWLAMIPFAMVLGLRDAAALAASAGIITLCLALTWWMSRARGSTTRAQYALLLLSLAGMTLTARLFSPFVLVPAGVYAATLSLSLTPHPMRRMAFLVIGCAGIVLPALFDVSGLVTPSFALRDNTLVILPTMTDLPPTLTFLALLAVHVVVLVLAARLLWRVRATFDDTARQVRLFAWQLQQMVPEHEGAGVSGAARPAGRWSLVEEILAPR